MSASHLHFFLINTNSVALLVKRPPETHWAFHLNMQLLRCSLRVLSRPCREVPQPVTQLTSQKTLCFSQNDAWGGAGCGGGARALGAHSELLMPLSRSKYRNHCDLCSRLGVTLYSGTCGILPGLLKSPVWNLCMIIYVGNQLVCYLCQYCLGVRFLCYFEIKLLNFNKRISTLCFYLTILRQSYTQFVIIIEKPQIPLTFYKDFYLLHTGLGGLFPTTQRKLKPQMFKQTFVSILGLKCTQVA